MEGYKYAERKVADQMDWSVVGRNITDTLKAEQEIRDKKKADIENSTNEFMNVLGNAPQGEHIDLNQYSLDYANDGTEMMLMLNRQFKSGQINMREYTKKRQSLMDSTNNMFGLVKEYQEEYKNTMDLYEKGQLGSQSVYEMTLLEGLSNFSSTKPYINPQDYSVTIGKKVLNKETGMYELSKDPADYQNINDLRNRLKHKTPKYDVDKATDVAAKAMGKELLVLRRGGVLTRQDVMQKKEYQDAEDKLLESFLVNPTDAASVLADFSRISADGAVYGFTVNPEEAKKDKNKILLQPDPQNTSSGRLVPVLSKEQMSEAKEVLRQQLRVKLDKEETPMPVFAPQRQAAPAKQDGGAGKAQERLDFATKVATLYHGGQGSQDVQGVIDYLLARGVTTRGQIISADRTANGVDIVVRNPQGKNETINIGFKDASGNKISQADFVQNMTTLMFGNVDIKSALQQDERYNPNLPLDEASSASSKVQGDVEPFNEDKMRVRTLDEFPKIRGISVNDSDRAKVLSKTRQILETNPNKQAVQGIKYSIDSGNNTLNISVPSLNKSVQIKIDTGEQAKLDATYQIEQLWNEIAQSSQPKKQGSTKSQNVVPSSKAAGL
jgi:hypothetical protein